MKITDTILVALLTLTINFLMQLFFKIWDKKTEKTAIQSAIIAEIKALKNIIEQRNYLKDIQSIMNYLEKNRGNTKTISLEIQSDVFPVYSNNLNKIGHLNPKLAPKVVTFYSLLSSILQDVKPDGLLSKQKHANFENYNNTYFLLKNALDLADDIIKEYSSI